ncbi:MAG: epoxyqueuosine reductase QueH [Thermotogota bacterium]
MKIFLHVCCAPDLTVSYEKLIDKKIIPTLFFYNPNIHPQDEYIKRKEEVIKLSKIWNLEIIKETYNTEIFYNFVTQNMKNRCSECIKFRLEESAKRAEELGFEFYSTTLLASPRKSHEIIKKWGDFYAEKYGINFLYVNFRSNNGVKRAAEICRSYDIYRQKYCGCTYSLDEAKRLDLISKEKNFENLKNLIGEKNAKKVFSLYKKDILKIPEDLSADFLYSGGLEVIKNLKPVITLMKKDIAKDFSLKTGRVKIARWKGKFLIW